MRDSKKADRKESIQSTALELFSQYGFAKTSMSQIAENAGLGTGTLYNYFKTKGDILLSIIQNRSCEYVEELDNIVKTESFGLVESLTLFHDYYLKSFSLYNKLIWRECMASVFSGATKLMKGIYEIDQPYLERLTVLLAKFRKAGILRENADIENLVLTLYDADMFAIFTFIADDRMTLKTLKTRLALHVEMIVPIKPNF